MVSGNPASPGDSTSPSDAFVTCVSSAMLTFPTPPNAESTTTSPSSSKMYVLTYNATIWAHEDTTDKITLLDRTPITVEPNEYISPATLQPVGVLGIYFSEAKARRTGKAWLYDQLMGLGEEVHLPLPTQDGSECTEPDWRKSGWQRMADGSWGYSISDYSPRSLALAVHVTEKSAIAADDDDANEEYWDSDNDFGKQRYKLVGPVGSRKRVVRTDEDEDDEEEEGEDEEDDESEETETEYQDADAGEGDGNTEGVDNRDAEGERDDMDMAEYWDHRSSDGDLGGSSDEEGRKSDGVEEEMEEV